MEGRYDVGVGPQLLMMLLISWELEWVTYREVIVMSQLKSFDLVVVKVRKNIYGCIVSIT